MPYLEHKDRSGGKFRYFYPSYVKAREQAIKLLEMDSWQKVWNIYETQSGKTVKETVQKYDGQYQVWIKGSKYGSYPLYKNGKIRS